MSKTVKVPENIDKICKNCEFSASGRNADERACFNVWGIRLALLGVRFVKATDTCSKFVLSRKCNIRSR